MPLSCSIVFFFLFSRKIHEFTSLFAFFQFHPIVSRNGKVHFSADSLLFLTITRFGCLAEIRLSVFTSKSSRILCVLFSRTDFGLCKYHLFEWLNLNFLHDSYSIPLPTQSYLVLAIFLLCDRSFRLYPHIIFIYKFVAFCLFLPRHSSYVFSVSFLPLFSPSFLAWNFACLSLEMSIHLFFVPFLFSGYFSFVDDWIVCIVSGRCNQSSSVFFLCNLLVVVSMYWRYLECL